MKQEKSKSVRNEYADKVHGCCQAWARWCQTREFYIKPGGMNLLARLQEQSVPEKGDPKRTGEQPNARNDPFMQHFNAAVHACKDMEKYRKRFIAFDHFYNPQNYPNHQLVKQIVAHLGIGTRTYYDHVESFGKAAYNLAASIKSASESMMARGVAGRAAKQTEEVD